MNNYKWVEQYKSQIQNIQWLIYDADKLTPEESSNLKRAIKYAQSKIRLMYFKDLYEKSNIRINLCKILEEKQKNVDKILTERYCNKSVLSSFGSKSACDLYDYYYFDLKKYQQLLEEEFFNNLVSDLLHETDVKALTTLCEQKLDTDIINNLETVCNIFSDNKLVENIKIYIEEKKSISELEYYVKESEKDINNLQFILDNYSTLSKFQEYLDQLYEEKVSKMQNRISELRLKKSSVECALKELDKKRNKWNQSNDFVKLLKYKENKSNNVKYNELLNTLSTIEIDEENCKKQLEQIVKEARKALIEFIENEDSVLFKDYIDKIEKYNNPLEIVDSKEFFTYKLYTYEELDSLQQSKRKHLAKLIQKVKEGNIHYNEIISIYKDKIGDNIELLNKIMLLQCKCTLKGIRPIIYLYILKLIYDTDKLSLEHVSLLINDEDKEKMKSEYNQSIESYLEIEQSHINDMYFNYKFKKDTGYNDESNLDFAKIKI